MFLLFKIGFILITYIIIFDIFITIKTLKNRYFKLNLQKQKHKFKNSSQNLLNFKLKFFYNPFLFFVLKNL